MAHQLLDRTGMRRAIITIAALLLLLGAAPTRAAEPRPNSDGCASYGAELRLARTRLQRGDRVGAVAALRRANEALRSCADEDSGHGGLVGHRDQTV